MKGLYVKRKIESLADIVSLDRGLVEALFRSKLGDVLEDLRDRPAVEGARKLSIIISMAPVQDDSGALSDLIVSFEVGAKFPIQKTRAYSMGVDGPSALTFNDASPDQIQQRTLDELENR